MVLGGERSIDRNFVSSSIGRLAGRIGLTSWGMTPRNADYAAFIPLPDQPALLEPVMS